MELRNAKPEDVKIFEHFYLTDNYEVLYDSATTSKVTKTETPLCDDVSEITIETFFKGLTSKEENIFIIEYYNTPIGIVHTSLISKGQVKLDSLCMSSNFKNQIHTVLNLLLKRFSKIKVHTTSPLVCKILEQEMLAEKKFKFFYCIKRPK